MNLKELVNIPLLLISVLLLVVGYYLLGIGPVDSTASWKIAPVVLVLTYVVLLPLSFILKKK